jgi:hypothetical protein
MCLYIRVSSKPANRFFLGTELIPYLIPQTHTKLWVRHRPIQRLLNIKSRKKPQKTRTFSHSPVNVRTLDLTVQDHKFVFYMCAQCDRHKELCLLGYNAVYSVESQSTFRRNMSSGSKNNKRETSMKKVASRAPLVPCCASETSVDSQRKTLHCTPEDKDSS